MQKNYSVISACDNLLRKVLPILLVLAFPWAAAGQSTPPTLTWSTDTTRIRIGEQIHLGLEVRAPKDALVDFPDFRFQSDSMEVVGRSKIDTSYKRDEAIYRITYRLTSFEKGKYLVPAIEVKAGESILTTDPFQVQVSTVEVDTLRQARYGIKDIRTKALRSNNPCNVVSAAMDGLRQLRTAEEAAAVRGRTAKEILG